MKYYIDFGVSKVKFIQYLWNEELQQDEMIGEKVFSVKENTDMWIDNTCKGHLAVQFLDSNDNILTTLARGQTDSYLNDGDCANFVNASNYNEELGQYADDTFGGTDEAAGTPGYDGSGGSPESPFTDIDGNGNPTDTGSGDGGTGDTGSGGTGDTGSGTPSTDEKLDELKAVQEQIKQAIQSNGDILAAINNATVSNGQKLDSIVSRIGQTNSLLQEIWNGMNTDVVVSPGTVPSVTNPDSSGRLERNKPSENPVFSDNTTYFEDNGDALESPGAMPSVPDVQDWDGVTKEPDGAAESELAADSELLPDGVLNPDLELLPDMEMGTSPEMTSDQYSQSPEMTSDQYSQSPEMNTDQYNQTEIYDQTNGGMNQTLFFEQTEIYNVIP